MIVCLWLWTLLGSLHLYTSAKKEGLEGLEVDEDSLRVASISSDLMHMDSYCAVNCHDCDKSNKINVYDYYPLVLKLFALRSRVHE